jgi:porin
MAFVRRWQGIAWTCCTGLLIVGATWTQAQSEEYALEPDAATDSAPICDCTPPPPAPAPQFGGCLWERAKLTGDWNGRRLCAAENGVTYDFDQTYFYYGVASGGRDQDFAFGGHGDYVVNMDLGKLAGHEGLFVKLRAEHRFGDVINGQTGGVLPATLSPGLPVSDSEDLYLTNVLITQALSEHFAVFAGKIDTLDGDANAFAHGRGKSQFSNVGFVANPALLRSVPYSTLAAGFVVLREMQPIFTFTALNATDTTRTSGFEDLFEEGVVLTAEARLPTQFFNLPGHQLFGGSWSSRDYVEIGQDPRVLLPNVPFAQQAGSWALYWNFDQYLVTYCDDPSLGWGVFGRAAVADDSTNPIDWFLSFGIGGNSPIRCRHQDTFGVGWFIASANDNFGPILQATIGPIDDAQCIELFYNYEIAPWCHLTADAQYIDPAAKQFDDSVVVGARLNVDF